MKRYRRTARFITERPSPVAFKVRLRLFRLAEKLARQTKTKGRKRGALSNAQLLIYHSLLFRFTDNATGACEPAIDFIKAATGFARSTVCEALKTLERLGLLRIMRRLVRRVVTICGRNVETTLQANNSYRFGEPHAHAHLLPVPVGPTRIERVVSNLMACLSMAESDPRGDKEHRGFQYKAKQAKQMA